MIRSFSVGILGMIGGKMERERQVETGDHVCSCQHHHSVVKQLVNSTTHHVVHVGTRLPLAEMKDLGNLIQPVGRGFVAVVDDVDLF